MFLPGVLQPSQLSQVRMGFDEEIGSKHMNMTTSVPLDGEARLQTMLTLPDHCTSSNQASNPIHSETSSGFQSTIQAHFSPFPLRVSSEVTLNMIPVVASKCICRWSNPNQAILHAHNLKETWRKDILPGQQLNVSHAERNPSGGYAVPVPPLSIQLKAVWHFCVFCKNLSWQPQLQLHFPLGYKHVTWRTVSL
jgi:hypothetical protein